MWLEPFLDRCQMPSSSKNYCFPWLKKNVISKNKSEGAFKNGIKYINPSGINSTGITIFNTNLISADAKCRWTHHWSWLISYTSSYLYKMHVWSQVLMYLLQKTWHVSHERLIITNMYTGLLSLGVAMNTIVNTVQYRSI